jgi:hypothetical protein
MVGKAVSEEGKRVVDEVCVIRVIEGHCRALGGEK